MHGAREILGERQQERTVETQFVSQTLSRDVDSGLGEKGLHRIARKKPNEASASREDDEENQQQGDAAGEQVSLRP